MVRGFSIIIEMSKYVVRFVMSSSPAAAVSSQRYSYAIFNRTSASNFIDDSDSDSDSGCFDIYIYELRDLDDLPGLG